MSPTRLLLRTAVSVAMTLSTAVGVASAPAGAEHRDGGDHGVVWRPIGDWLQNNPHGFNVFGLPIGGTGSDANVLINFGYNPHLFPTPDRDSANPDSNDVWDGSDPFGYPEGFDSILAESRRPTPTLGFVRQVELPDGGVEIQVRAFVIDGPVSVYDEDDIFGAGGFGSGGPGGCSLHGGSLGSGCNDLPGGSGEPSAVLGQDENGSFKGFLSVDFEYTADGVAAAGGDLDQGIAPTIPFVLPALFGITPGVAVTGHEMTGDVSAKVTDDAALAAKFGVDPGARVLLRYEDTPERFSFELVRPRS